MNEIQIYSDRNNQAQIEVRFENETVWLTQKQMAELFKTTSQNITLHLKKIYKEAELEEAATCKEYLQVQVEGNRKVKRQQLFYNLDAILSVGYRINSKQGTQFRQWATQRLKDHLVKGYTINQKRLEQPYPFMKRILVLLFFLASSPIFSQPVVQSLNSYFTEVRAGKYPAIPQEVTKPENAKVVISALPAYQKDTLFTVRSKAFSITRAVGVKAKQPAIRQESVQQLINGGRDKDSGIVGSVLGNLTEFRKEDFTIVAKDSLRSLFKSKPAHLHQLVKLIGFLELNDLQSDLRAISQQNNAGKRDRWAAQLALARMGDQMMIQNILERVKKLPINDDLVYEVFPDLIYTRQMEAISYLTRVLFSDENNCETADAEREAKIPCAYRVMEQLAPVIENYPFALDASGDVKTKDYVAALKKVREWFRQQKEYKILKDTY